MSASTPSASTSRQGDPRLLEIHRLVRIAEELDRTLAPRMAGPQGRPWLADPGWEPAILGALSHLGPHDAVFPNRRSLALPLLRGWDLEDLTAAILERGPKAGPVPYGEAGVPELGLQPAAIVHPTRPLEAVGYALGASRDVVTAAVLGDAHLTEGPLNMALAMARARKARLFFVALRGGGEHPAFAPLAEGFGWISSTVTGNDVLAVVQDAEELTRRLREEGRPALLEVLVSEDSPAATLRGTLRETGVLDEDLDASIMEAVRAEVRGAVDAALALPARSRRLAWIFEACPKVDALAHRSRDAWLRFGREYGGNEDPDASHLAFGGHHS